MSQYQRRAAAAGIFRTCLTAAPGNTLRRWWMAYMMWRLERLAIAQLRAFSDRELEGMGLVRADIRGAVRSWMSPCSPLLV